MTREALLYQQQRLITIILRNVKEANSFGSHLIKGHMQIPYA